MDLIHWRPFRSRHSPGWHQPEICERHRVRCVLPGSGCEVLRGEVRRLQNSFEITEKGTVIIPLEEKGRDCDLKTEKYCSLQIRPLWPEVDVLEFDISLQIHYLKMTHLLLLT